jgi:protein-S-isoprenylcysteine O-methyltransferase Ste14
MAIPNLQFNIIVLCWIIFFGYWLISAFFVKKTIERSSSIGWRLITPIIGIIIIIFLVKIMPQGYAQILTSIIIPNTLTSAIIGSLITILGLAICIWARTTIGRNWSGSVVFKKNHELVTNGPYKFVRHPIYTGMITMLIGTSIYYGYASIFLIPILAFVSFALKSRQEEKLMIKHFGKKYIEYKKRTKAIIPFVI